MGDFYMDEAIELITEMEKWRERSRKKEVCGIWGCEGKPVTQCVHCLNHYCQEHRWLLETPAHPVTSETENGRRK